eukprot:COSAG01_NODE_8116_length_2915_cov_2.975497_4_plen_92_part_00
MRARALGENFGAASTWGSWAQARARQAARGAGALPGWRAPSPDELARQVWCPATATAFLLILLLLCQEWATATTTGTTMMCGVAPCAPTPP